jgi:opacity protein-like surface antigen
MVFVAWLVPSAAAAQTGGVLVSALGGATVGTTSGPVVAGRVSGDFAGGIQPFGEVGWVGDALPNSFRDFVDDVIDEFGVGPVDVDLNLRAVYGLFGVRWVPDADASVRPYVEGGIGVARLSASFSVRIGGIEFTEDDVPFGVPTSETEPALGFGGGVIMPLTPRVALDLGYRYVFISSGENIHLHKLLGGIRVGF